VNSYLKRKYIRFFESSKILKVKYLLHKLFKEKDIGTLELNFQDKPHRSLLVQEIINKKKYNSYLEIGCFSDELFSKIKCKHKIGIDPVSGGTIRKTSDDFFSSNQEYFDCVFIDGLHIYHQVKKDIYNSIKCLNKGGIILLHDCLPKNVYDQAVPRCQYNWNGDVWKAIVELRTKKDLDIYTCYADNGIGVIFNRPNRNILNIEREDFSKMKFSEYYNNYKEYMNLIFYEELFKIL